MTEKTFTAATMKVKLASEQTLSAKLTADARMTAKMDLMYKGDKGDKGDTGETIASAYCNPDGTMVLTMDSGRRVATNLQPLTDSMGYAESAKESASQAASSQSAAAGSESAAAGSEAASATSASAAKTSETNAKASETKAAGSASAAASSASAAASSASAASSSQSVAKTSETNAKTSETNAAASASAAAASARTQQSDWTETDSTFQSFIKNKPTNLLTTNTTQTITGDKEFTGAVIMATGKITTVNATTVDADTASADTVGAVTVNATSLTVTGSTSVPTANADNNSNTVANTAFVKTAIANIVNGAPSQLDTLQELSAALGNDANFSATVANEIGEKVSKSGDTITGPILYDKTPNDDTELPNKSCVDAAINSAVTSVTKTLSDNMHAQYPVGSYIYSDKADNPATYLPYMSDTTWVQTAAGRVLIGAGTADSGTVYTAGQTGGEEKHQLTVEELAQHKHQIALTSGGYAATEPKSIYYTGENPDPIKNGMFSDRAVGETYGDGKTAYYYDSSFLNNTGDNHPHNNMEPYKVVYIFMRSA
ncbi:phage baseplate protein [Dialister hominis]|uniref:phage baseplate protein n=1 Tax=Dialister hominis TaxID=2582419 RepID=UPI003FEE87BE